MPLLVHRAARADALVEGLASVLATAASDPFTTEIVAVPSRGVERWIAQSLSSTLGAGPAGSDGVCANVVFPSPRRLVRDALAAASGVDEREDPWSEQRLVWSVLEVIDGCASEQWCRTLGRHLGLAEGGVDRGRRVAVAQKLARLYTSYAAERPHMLLDWVSDRDTDGYDDLEPDLRWQAELWRRVRGQLAVSSPAERLAPGCVALRADPRLTDLPERLSVFGPTRLTIDELTVLDALGTHRDVHLWLPHPSEGMWQRLTGLPAADAPLPARAEDSSGDLLEYPLVRSLGKDAREMQLRLRAYTTVECDQDLGEPVSGEGELARLQRAIVADRIDARGSVSPGKALGDHRIAVHACHGPSRQVEVLREIILGLLDDDPTLELRDIIVMCPDIEAYAPLVSAAFGALPSAGPDGQPDDQPDDPPGEAPDGGAADSAVHPGHSLSFRLADRSLRQTNPVLGVLARLLDLADARLTASEVLDLAAMAPVRRRFRLDDEELERASEWVRRSGVRWGLDEAARGIYDLDRVGQNTWRAGLDRILLGVAMDEDHLAVVGAVVPLDDVGSGEVALAGKLAELVDRLGRTLTTLNQPKTLEEWVAAWDRALEDLTAVSARDAWQLTQARATLAAVQGIAPGSASRAVLRLSDARALWADRLAGRPTRANFRTGHLTICTMVPMRSVPHRVVCLLGLDDGVFPRSTEKDGDDILARRPRVGERDRRSEDRQLLLDAILAAKERLVLLYTGADERTGAVRPPAVPLGELLDALGGAFAAEEAGLLIRHPLQPFDARNFSDAALAGAGAFSFDRASYDGSLALRHGATQAPPFLERALAPQEMTTTVSLEAMARFLEHPVRGFLRERLEIRTADEQQQPSDDMPVAPNALDRWQVGERLLRAGLAGHDLEAAARVECLRGELPPGSLGREVVDSVIPSVEALLACAVPFMAGDATSVDVAVDLSSAVLTGTITSLYDDKIVRVEYSRLSAKHRIRAWLQLLALCACSPGREWRAVTLGRGGPAPAVAASFLTGIEAPEARRHLDALIELYRLGLTRPLPLPPKTAAVYAGKRREDVVIATALKLAGKEWMKPFNGRQIGEFDDGDHRLVGFESLADLTGDGRPTEARDFLDEPHLFGLLARRVWTPLLDAEITR